MDTPALHELPLIDPAPKPVLAARDPIPPARREELAKIFRALGDVTRLHLVSLIAASPTGEACVCDLVDAFDLSQPAISHHLKILRDVGLVTSQRRGTWAYYRVQPQWLDAVGCFLGRTDAS